MNKEYNIHIITNNDDELDKACSIAFDSGKGYCGCGFTEFPLTRFYIYGKFHDYVRVYAALKNNGFRIVGCNYDE